MATPKTNKPHGNLKDITGQTFGKLTVIRRSITVKQRILWLCRCECGVELDIIGGNLTRGLSTSCGSGIHRAKHGMIETPEYKAWEAAKQRCLNPAAPEYCNYGARGITFAEEWVHDFLAFFRHIGKRPAGLSIDRIDNDKGYQPGNVRWATTKQQFYNRRNSVLVTHLGETLSLKDWAVRTGISESTLRVRYYYDRENLFTPVGTRFPGGPNRRNRKS